MPFAVLATVVIGIQAITVRRPTLHARLMDQLGNSWDDLASLRLYRLLTSSLIQTESGLQPLILVLVAAASWAVATRVDGRQAVALWFSVDAIATVVLFVSYRLVSGAGSGRASEFLTTRDGGASSGGIAVGVASLLTITSPARRWIAVGSALAIQIPLLMIFRRPAYIHHMIAIVTTVGLVHLLDHLVDRGAVGQVAMGRQ